MTNKNLMLGVVTIKQAIDKCKELNLQTGKTWFFKANKGMIKLACDNNNDGRT